MFQHLNPFFIVVLTPVIVIIFNWLRNRNSEPSAPKKIGIGMVISAVAFSILIIASLKLIGSAPPRSVRSGYLMNPSQLLPTGSSALILC